ncbi:metallophosphoesterase [Sphingomonas sp. HDW15A]|uniref:metallophosphoesterase family protein n=1 Tax=Sphingomonas sp. HDW15A TaxID=2714942 RepID=UPI00140D3588|nr:metallophosphoesterase [Sphingomonas sp. HDW15A]QIK96361.1 metallophosphoesterase [Sphingomonas sp. HDW15A]
MARIFHLSDLHFGAHDERLVEAVEERINAGRPDLVVISGDFTQRARTDQFEEACAFLTRLRDSGHEVLGVPGNHDVPLYDVLRRFLSPLTRYKRYIDETLCPFHEVPGAAVLGINTARSLTFKDGRINEEQMEFIRSTFARVGDVPRILVTHHPLFALPVSDGLEVGKAIGRQDLALDSIGEAGVDILLAGHNHRASTHSARDLATRAGPALVIQAGTATSTRLRDEEQSFNQIDIEGRDVVLTIQTWGGSGFVAGDTQGYRRDGDHWRPIAEAEADVETA